MVCGDTSLEVAVKRIKEDSTLNASETEEQLSEVMLITYCNNNNNNN
jgi:hypothetical protein